MQTSSSLAPLQLDSSATPPALRLSGDWTLARYAALRGQVNEWRQRLDGQALAAELDGIDALDTAGAALLVDLLGAARLIAAVEADASLGAERRNLLLATAHAHQGYVEEPAAPSESAIREVLAHIGATVDGIRHQLIALLGFIGLTLASLARTAPRPRRWRVTSLVVQIEQTGLDAVPIVALLTFLVGAVVAFLGATVLASFGASIYTVDLVAFAFLREFGVLLAAILLAGRTASAFTAQIGSMKANEEIDAIRTLGLDPVELLVLPRVLAMLVTLPLLTFIAMLCGIVGGAVVCFLSLDISLLMYFSMLHDDIALKHFLVGMAKAPVFAFLIAVIGCLEGFKVAGSAQSVGAHTTSAVVQSIFVVILLDAVAALFFMEMGW